jgi:Fe2+ or Zn2+ uptake regulation protein
MTPSIEIYTQKLKDKGIRPSLQRVKVLEYMHRIQGHPTVDEIFRALSVDIPSLSKVTVYNTLHTLVEAGLVQEVEIDDTEKRFDVTLTNHGHFQCVTCGMIYNFHLNIDQVPFDGLTRFEIRQKNVYFKGICSSCLEQSFQKGEKDDERGK